jgi:hypothetical protein
MVIENQPPHVVTMRLQERRFRLEDRVFAAPL